MVDLLYVDDSPVDRQLFEHGLRKGGWDGDIMSVASVRAAMEHLAEGDGLPDIIVTDVMMPEQDGFDLLEKVRGDDGLASIPVFIYTSSAWDHDRRRAFRMGCSGYILKPASVEDIDRHARFFEAFIDVAGLQQRQ